MIQQSKALKIAVFDHHTQGPPAIISTNLTLPAAISPFLLLTVWVYLNSHFYSSLQKHIFET